MSAARFVKWKFWSFKRRSRRRVLVVLRAGDASSHSEWLQGAPPESRVWDWHLSYFGGHSHPFPNRPADGFFRFAVVRNKTKALYEQTS